MKYVYLVTIDSGIGNDIIFWYNSAHAGEASIIQKANRSLKKDLQHPRF